MSTTKNWMQLGFYIVPSLLLLVSLMAVIPAGADFLADKHKKSGMTCGDCHKENVPRQNVVTTICQNCHGDYSKLADKTAKTVPNPHETHLGELACTQCHRGHKQGVLPCVECHEFDLKIP